MQINYNRPFDSDMFPEGLPRCDLLKFLLGIGPVSLVLLLGVYAAFRVLAFGLGETNLDDYFGFGLWIGFDLAIIALGAGAFFTGLLRYILNIDPLKNIINLAVIIGFICYSGAVLVLTLDIGQPLRAWFSFWHANVHSMLTEVIFCITCYLIVLLIEYLPLVLEQRQLNKIPFLGHLAHNLHLVMPLFAGIGAFLSTFHQGSLGGMYGVLFGRPFAFREGFFIWPWTFFLFILSAVSAGPMLTTLVCTLIEKITRRRMVTWDIKQIMGRIAGTMLLIYLVCKILDTFYWAVSTLPAQGLRFSDMFDGFAYGAWILFLEVVICGVLPCIALLIPKFRNNPILFYSSGILVCLGVSINRYIITVQTLAHPVLPFDKWQLYLPNWVEWACVGLVFAYGALLISLSYRYLPLFPQERKLNQPD
ncbi:polysulfide reductase NrfD [Desulfovibrio sp. OttesenSCG-928-C14]|nr:polysulfide reductase NrfD [Desulfovibrio sp. OttesenSCG-928-C14]